MFHSQARGQYYLPQWYTYVYTGLWESTEIFYLYGLALTRLLKPLMALTKSNKNSK